MNDLLFLFIAYSIAFHAGFLEKDSRFFNSSISLDIIFTRKNLDTCIISLHTVKNGRNCNKIVSNDEFLEYKGLYYPYFLHETQRNWTSNQRTQTTEKHDTGRTHRES